MLDSKHAAAPCRVRCDEAPIRRPERRTVVADRALRMREAGGTSESIRWIAKLLTSP
jgi:hypothetical protein